MFSTKSHAALLICFVWASSASAESRPSLDSVVRRDILIVKCRVEIKDKQLNYRVLESWKGTYSPDLFEQPPAKNYLFARPIAVEAARNRDDGQEVIVFFSDNALAGSAHKPRKLDAYRMDDSIPAVDGKITWELERDFADEPYTLAEFKRAVLKYVAEQAAQKQK